MKYSSRYATCAGREIHYTEWGSEHSSTVIAWHGLARTGPRHGRIGRAPFAAASASSARTPWAAASANGAPIRATSTTLAFYAAAGRRAVRPVGDRAGALGRHLDGRRDRHGVRGRAVPAATEGTHPEPGAQRQRAPPGRAGARAHPRLRRQSAGLRHDGATGGVLSPGLQALWLAQRCAMAAPDRNLDAPPARRPRHAALRPRHGAPVHRPSRTTTTCGRTTTRSRSRCCACAVRSRTWCCPMRPRK